MPNTATASVRWSSVSPCSCRQRLQAALQRDLLGDVLVDVGHAAVGVRHGDDAERAAVGQMPELLARLRRCGRRRGASRASRGNSTCSGSFRSARSWSRMALSSGRGGEPVGGRAPDRAEGGVVEEDAAVAAEHRDAGGQLVERAGIGLASAASARSRTASTSETSTRAADRAVLDRHVEHLQRRRSPATIADGAVVEGAADALASRIASRVRERQELDAGGQHGLRARRLDRLHIGGVHPGQPAGAIAPPEREAAACRRARGAPSSR